MKNISLKRSILYLFLFVLLFISLSYIFIPNNSSSYVDIDMQSEQSDSFQVYYTDVNSDFSEDNSVISNFNESDKIEKITVNIPVYDKIRLDFGTVEGNTIKVENIKFVDGNSKCLYNADDIYSNIENGDFVLNQISAEKENGLIVLKTQGNDPFILINSINYMQSNIYPYIIAAFLISIVLTLIIYKYVYLKDVYQLIKSVFLDRKLLISLAANDFKVKYAGSYFGILWAFVQPICTILVFRFVFYYLKSAPVSNVPFSLWLTAGLVPWFFFSEAWNSATNAFIEYSYLVKKVVFKIDILPLVKILSAFFVHLFFVVFMIFLYLINGFLPHINMFFLIYYMCCMGFLVIGISFITASIVVFFKDLTQIMNIFLQVFMWLTPIMWSTEILPAKVARIFELNPMYYVVQGYRNCMIENTIVLPDLKQTVYFWVVSILLFFIGISLFRRLKFHFSDVL